MLPQEEMQEQGRAPAHQLLHQWQPGRPQGLRERQDHRRLALEYMVGVPLFSYQARLQNSCNMSQC